MDKIRKLLSQILSNKKQVITSLLIGITVLSIPVGLQLAQQQQTLKSQAAGSSVYKTDRGPQTVDQMRNALSVAGYGNSCGDFYCKDTKPLSSHTEYEVFRAFLQAAKPNPFVGCVVNQGDMASMPTSDQQIVTGTPVQVSVIQLPGQPGLGCYEKIDVVDVSGLQDPLTGGTKVCTAESFRGNDFAPDRVKECGFTPTRVGTYKLRVYKIGHSGDPNDKDFNGVPKQCNDEERISYCEFITVAAGTNPGGGSPGASGTPALPTPVDVTYTGTGTVTCNANNVATLTWPAANIPGKTTSNYTLRINKSPADWAPNVDVPPTTAVDGDRALQAGNNLTMTVALTPGEYLDWTIQPGFSDNTFARNQTDMGPAFTCPGGSDDGGTSGDCTCRSDSCTTSCTFNKLTNQNITYANPVKCNLSNTNFSTIPSQTVKNTWCSRQNRTKGDANGDNKVDEDDYFYYLRAVTSGTLPPQVNPDFDGDGTVGTSDLAIWKAGKGN